MLMCIFFCLYDNFDDFNIYEIGPLIIHSLTSYMILDSFPNHLSLLILSCKVELN